MNLPRTIKLRRFKQILSRYGITVQPGGKHSVLCAPDGGKFPIPCTKASDDVFRSYVQAARRKFDLTPEHGISDEDLYRGR